MQTHHGVDESNAVSPSVSEFPNTGDSNTELPNTLQMPDTQGSNIAETGTPGTPNAGEGDPSAGEPQSASDEPNVIAPVNENATDLNTASSTNTLPGEPNGASPKGQQTTAGELKSKHGSPKSKRRSVSFKRSAV